MTRRLQDSSTVLLVNDHDELREATGDLLSALGCQVTTVSGVEEALAALDGGAAWDLVVCDVPQPSAGGAERLRDLCVHRGTRGVVLTSNGAAAPALRRCLGGRARLLRKPFSAADLRAALEHALAAGARMSPPRRASRRPSRRLAPAWGLAAAAVLVLAVGAILRTSAPPLPEPAASTVRRGTDLELAAPLGDVAGVPAELRWQEVAGAARYRVRILGVDDRLLWEATATGDRAALPSEARATLRPGVVRYWQVEALDGGGTVTARSERARFRVLPEG